MTDIFDRLDYADPDDVPVPYMQRTRDYYLTLGYGNPYQWAHYAVVPFTPLEKPLAEARVALITTAAPYQPDKGDQGPGAAYNASAKFYQVYSGDSADEPDLRISHLGYDRAHTTAADINSYLPLKQLKAAARAGRIGELAPRFHGMPTNRSQLTTIDVDCRDLLERCREDQVDAVVIAGN